MKLAMIDIIGLPYDGHTLRTRGLGGSESCVIQLSQELSQLGFEVTVFNNCDVDDSKSGWYDGVEYVDISNLSTTQRTFDVVIALRTCYPFLPKHVQFEENWQPAMRLGQGWDNIVANAKWKMIWLHDTFIQGENNLEQCLVEGWVDEIICLSDWHATYILNCDHGCRRNFEVLKNRVFMARNCMTRYLDHVDVSKKDPNLFVYNSSVTKGMVPLLEHVWPLVHQRIPQARLKVIGGFYRFRSNESPDQQEQTWTQLRDQNHNQRGVEFTGIIRQDQIAEVLAKASFFIYPTAFPETFGISTLEAQAYGCVPITCRFGALEEVAMDQSSWKIDYSVEPNVLFPNIDQPQQVRKFVDQVVYAHSNPLLNQQKMYHGMAVADIATWDTMAIQLKQHLYRKLNKYLPVTETRRANWLNQRVHQLFKRRFSNHQEWLGNRSNHHRMIYVISPVRNGAAYVGDHVLSVASQDYDQYCHILIDDASTDNTLAVWQKTIDELDNQLQSKFVALANHQSVGAVCNQITTARQHITDQQAIVVLLDGDDCLTNDPNIFHHINTLYDQGARFTYGSCWSQADQIPLIAQPYPPHVHQAKSYRQHRFNWGIPYTHLRTFERSLLEQVTDQQFQHQDGSWYRAGGDVAVFYNLIEKAQANEIVAVPDILCYYNDLNPLNDYKVHSQEQNQTAAKIAQTTPI